MCIFGVDDALLAGGAMALGGSLIGAHSAGDINEETMKFNHDEAMLARGFALDQSRFQERMANTAYQRQTADMKAAGINPMLAVMKGGGAPAPAGASPSTAASTSMPGGNPADSIQRGLISAVEMARVKSQNKVNDAVAEQNYSSSLRNDMEGMLLQKKAQTEVATAKKMDAEADVAVARKKAAIKHANIDADWANFDAGINRTEKTVNSFMPKLR